MNFGLIVAAGQGKRFGGTKQFFPINGKPVVLHTIQTFERSRSIDKIIIVVNRQKVKYMDNLLKSHKTKKIQAVVSGGKERQDSVWNGLQALPNEIKGYVAIHDGVRPLFETKFLAQGFNLCRTLHAVICALPLPDTIKTANNKVIVKTIDRTNLYLIQTPQFFEIELIKKAYQKARADKFYATDDSTLVERLGVKVHILSGSTANFKITNRDDLKLVKRLIQRR